MIRKYRLSNGIEVVSEPMENRRTVSVGIFIRVGSADERKEENGISHLIEHMLFQGTGRRTAKEIADITARMGDDVNAFTSKECTALYGTTITENLSEMIALLGDMLTDSLMEEKELAKEKRIIADEIDMYADSAEDLVHELLQKRVWRTDALGYLISGTKTTVKGFRREQIKRFMANHYCAENIIVSSAGGYQEEELLAALEDALASVKAASSKEMPDRKKGRPDYYCSFVTQHKEMEQLHMNLAFPALCLGDDRGFAYSIMNSAFGGSNNSRLFQKIREETGLAYSVYSYASAYERGGLFHIDITVQPEHAVLALEKTIALIREFVRLGMTEEELAMHKQQIRTEIIMNAESPRERMESNAKYILAKARLYSMEEKIEQIQAITCADVSHLAAECMDLGQCSICIVGDRSSMDLRRLKKIWLSLRQDA